MKTDNSNPSGNQASAEHLWQTFHIFVPLVDGDSHDGAVLPVPESMLPQTKVPLYGRDHISSRKAQAMKQAKDRKKQLARLGQSSNLDFTPLSLDKLEPEFVSGRITKMQLSLRGT